MVLRPRADPDAEGLRQQRWRGHRRAHLETDSASIGAHLAESVTEVADGRVGVRSREEIVDFFAAMFEGASYETWEDAVPPVLRISRDATMAWVSRTVRVRRRGPGPEGHPTTQSFTSAYTATYEKRDGSWRMTPVTSTFPGG